MKPLELRIHAKHPVLDAYRFGPSYTPYAIVAVDKRFREAELAAEYLFVVHGDNTVLEWHYWEGEYRSPQSIAEKVFHFASRPNFDEDPQ